MSHPTPRAPRGDQDPSLREIAREHEDAYFVEYDEDGVEDEDEDEGDEDVDFVAWETTDDEEWGI